jgi:cytochrome b subunit of formate dehydrogenase
MTENHKYLRFRVPERIEHWLLMLSFTILAITGLVQKFASSGLSEALISAMGGIENVRVIHRIAAIVLMLEVVYHLGVVGYKVLVRRKRMTMLPGMDDVQAALGNLQHNLGLRRERPKQARYTVEEKAEYWALAWGTLIMVVTGFMLWNPIATAKLLPGQFIPAAKIAHGGEAILASLAIIVWHFYGVHARLFNKSMFSGRLNEEAMEEEHPLELAEITAGVTDRPVAERQLKKRRRSYAVVFGIVAVVMLAGIFWFVTFEETAITTVPPAEDVVVFAPLTPTPFPTPPPTATPRPTSTPKPTPTVRPTAEPGAPTAEPEEAAPEVGVFWADVADTLQDKCGACHSEANALGGLDLSSHEGALDSVEPGDPDASVLVILQDEGGHAGQLEEEELELVRQWIENGALETPESGAAPPTAELAAGVVWPDVADMLQDKCGACHNEANALGGLDLSSYEGALGSVEPGDPDASVLVILQVEGEHPGQLEEEELELVRQWIASDALEE